MKVLCYGSLNIDKVYTVEDFVRPSETIKCYNYQENCGGKGLNQAIALKKAGMKVSIAGKIGTDGQILIDCLRKENVDVSFIFRSNDVSGHAIIQIDEQGKNSIIVYGGANEEISKQEIIQVLSHYNKNDTIVLQNEISNLDFLIEKAFEIGMTIVLNLSPIDKQIDSIDLSKIDYLIINEIEATSLTHFDTVEGSAKYLIDKYNELRIVITLGEKGSVYYDKGHNYTQNAYHTNVVDTTAAGDTFLGYFVASISKDDDVKKALAIATRASTITISRSGASKSIPTILELK